MALNQAVRWRLVQVAVLLSFLVLSHPVQAAPCAFGPIPQQPVIFGQFHKMDPFASERVRGATTVMPFTMQVKATGPIKLRWNRLLPPTPVNLQERLLVSRSRDSGATFEDFCDTGWVSVAQLYAFAQLSLDADGPTIWRAQVFEDDKSPTMTVLDEERPMLTMTGAFEGKPSVFPAPLPYFDTVRADLPGAPPPCSVTKQAEVSDASPVTAASIAEGGLQIEGTVYAVSGRTLRFKIDRAPTGPPVRILMSAKPVGYGIAPRPVCAITVKLNDIGADEWITATAPWAMITEFRWRITLDSDGVSPKLHYAVFRERRHSMAGKDTRSHSTDAYSCTNIDVSKGKPVDPLRAEMFQGAYALTLHTNLKAQGVTGDAYRQIVYAILTSIDSWRVVCTSCTPYQFSVIDIDGQVYVAANMLQGPSGDYRATFNPMYPWMWRVFAQKSTGLFSSALSFVPVSGTARQRQRFCLQQDETNYGFSAAQSPLCRTSPPGSDQEMVINVEWTQKLSCDDRPTVVACWNGTDLIELNVKDYSFYVGDTGDVLLGSAAKGADLIRVFTHEVGHWLGLAHMAGDGNIMSDELAGARCIDDRNMRTINEIAHGEIKRTDKPEALRYE